jgi:Trehalase
MMYSLFDEEPETSTTIQTSHAPDMKKAIWHYPGGIPTSEVISGQQWDFPNAWAPFQYYMVESLLKLSIREKQMEDSGSLSISQNNSNGLRSSQKHYKQALEIANRWISSTYCGWNRTGQFFEKYNVIYTGMPGEGGEYVVQEGFGWTNAVILMMLEKFGNEIVFPDSCAVSTPSLHQHLKKSLLQSPIPASPNTLQTPLSNSDQKMKLNGKDSQQQHWIPQTARKFLLKSIR